MRNVVSRLIVTALLGTTGAAAADGNEAYLAGGVVYASEQARTRMADYGYYGAFGYIDRKNSGAFGMSAVDLEYRTLIGRGNRLDSYSVCYAERAMITGEGVYLGMGIGSWYHRLRDSENDVHDQRWRPGAKGMVGLEIGQSLFIEVSYHYSGQIGGINTAAATGALGLRL
jgi:hypothetical protein